jgi:hypothetical protein
MILADKPVDGETFASFISGLQWPIGTPPRLVENVGTSRIWKATRSTTVQGAVQGSVAIITQPVTSA